jgi:hypothetical protein
MHDPPKVNSGTGASAFQSGDSLPVVLTAWSRTAKPYQNGVAVGDGAVHGQQCCGGSIRGQVVLTEFHSVGKLRSPPMVNDETRLDHSQPSSHDEKAPAEAEAFSSYPIESEASYFAAAAAVASVDLAYLRRNRSTRPAVSTSLCLPVKNGWQLEQIST